LNCIFFLIQLTQKCIHLNLVVPINQLKTYKAWSIWYKLRKIYILWSNLNAAIITVIHLHELIWLINNIIIRLKNHNNDFTHENIKLNYFTQWFDENVYIFSTLSSCIMNISLVLNTWLYMFVYTNSIIAFKT